MKSPPPLHVEQFHFYNPDAPLSISRRDLPHWEQEGVCAFVTFRMEDSLPDAVLEKWAAERRKWLLYNGINPDAAVEWRKLLEELSEETVNEYHRRFTARLHDLLDAGHGECVLRRADVRAVVENSLLYWHGERCLLAGWVIMPNHVHALVQPSPGH